MQGEQSDSISAEKLAALRVLPVWDGDLTVKPLKGGISNESWIVSDCNGPKVVRFGQDYPFHHVDRAHEAMVARAAEAAGLAPKVIAVAPGIMITEFLDAVTGSAASIRQDIAGHAGLVRTFHQSMPAHVSGPARLFWVSHVIRDYARTLKANASRHVPGLDRWLALSSGFEAAQIPLPLVYAHNDLLPANFLYSGGRIWLIDFEYAGYSTAMFDLAGLSSNAGFTPDESGKLLEAYFGHMPNADMIRSLEAMQCASILREAMWSMVSEIYLNAPGVDYVAYTAAQLQAFDLRLEDYQSRYGKIATS